MNPNAIFIITIAMLGVATIHMLTDAIDKNESKHMNDPDKFRRQAAVVAIGNEEDSNNDGDFSVFESYYDDGINSTNHNDTTSSANYSADPFSVSYYYHSENTTTPTEYSSESETNKIFYFAITHSSNTDRGLVNASIATWCRRVVGRPVVWYSNKAQPGVDHVISFDGVRLCLIFKLDAFFLMHFNPFQEDSTENITFRMAAVWRHVAQNYGGYEWYARFWDDNYVVVKDFEDIIKRHNPNLPIEIGRLADFSTNQLIRVGEERNNPLSALLYVDGGAGSMLSHEAMRRLTMGMDICIEEVDPKVFTCAWRCEVLS